MPDSLFSPSGGRRVLDLLACRNPLLMMDPPFPMLCSGPRQPNNSFEVELLCCPLRAGGPVCRLVAQRGSWALTGPQGM